MESWLILGPLAVAALGWFIASEIHTLRKREDFPPAVINLAATPVWDRDALFAFKEGWKKTTTQIEAPNSL